MATQRRLQCAAGALLAVVVAGCGGGQAPTADVSQADSITNNQEAGVDEGGIVKAWGDYLVVLRRGRLFTVDLRGQSMAPVCAVDAYAPGSEPGSWYDELLVAEDRVVVVGYTYELEATEIGLFSLDGGGCIHHEATYYLQSNDYYSSRNYASRLVDGHLVMYMPHWIGSYTVEDGRVETDSPLPALGSLLGPGGLFARYDWDEIVDETEIEVPDVMPSSPALHTVITCDLEDAFTCRGRGIIGGWGRSFYVSRDAVFVWVSDPYRSIGMSTVYRLPLDGGPTGAVQAFGAPIDQFSFQQDEAYLNVLVRSEGGGDWMWSPEQSSGPVALARIPLNAFAQEPPLLPHGAYTALPAPPEAYGFVNRFAAGHVLYNADDPYGYYGYYDGQPYDTELMVYPVDGRGPARALPLPHRVERIEVLGDDAVVIGAGPSGLHFTSIELGSAPRVAGSYVQPAAHQGEQRSHGFFFRRDSDDSGILGLPLQRGYTYYGYLTDASVSVLYLAIEKLGFRSLGTLDARGDDIDDSCVASCVDWYGNSRPIFYRNRVFALMGYELVEGVVDERRIHELARVHLLANQPRASLAHSLR